MDFKRVMNLNSYSKKGQVTIFIIIAIVILAGVAAYFIFRGTIFPASQISQEFQPAYNTFLNCIENTVKTGASVLESQGGYITLPQFKPGSLYMPFSSQLNFLGNPIPYWFYVSGNNIAEQQVPSLSDMQSQLAQYINNNIRNCDFSSYSDLSAQMGTPSASVSINPDSIDVNLKMDLSMEKGNNSVFVSSHKASVNSELGNLYKSALTVYNYEQTNLFLENYTVDVLRNYAPVDGIQISCAPLTWNARTVVSNLSTAIQNNILSLHSGNDVNYFNVRVPVENVRFLTSPDWPSTYEVNPTQGDLMIAQPIGNQQGLGVLGFCYVPYHFVYDVKYPVLATITKGNEIFQFPMAVILQGNKARNATTGTASSANVPILCENKNTPVTVSVYNSNSDSIDANVSYECFSTTCNIGQTSAGTLTANFPQCVNGYVAASANGYKAGRTLFTTTKSGTISITLDRLYDERINLLLDGNLYSGNAIITFASSDGTSQTVLYPQQKNVQLSEGSYNVQVSIYKNSSISIGATTKQQCVSVASPGLLGFLGATQQQCFDINLPAQVISNALAGGGQRDLFILESDLRNSNSVQISASSLPAPTSLNQLQSNYFIFANKSIDVSFQ